MFRLLVVGGERLFGHVLTAVLTVAVGALVYWWKMRKEAQRVKDGNDLETIGVERTFITRCDGVVSVHTRSCGSAPSSRVFGCEYIQKELSRIIAGMGPANPVVVLAGDVGSFILHQLQGWVSGVVTEVRVDPELWILCLVAEKGDLTGHKTTTAILVPIEDLKYFADWTNCREIFVEHGADGARVISLHIAAKKFLCEEALIAEKRAAGERTKGIEEFFILDLCLLKPHSNKIPTKRVPWSRYGEILTAIGLEA
ncbi:MAG: hypothetical protein U0136_13385 [Bdellovibrionota bacterium]